MIHYGAMFMRKSTISHGFPMVISGYNLLNPTDDPIFFKFSHGFSYGFPSCSYGLTYWWSTKQGVFRLTRSCTEFIAALRRSSSRAASLLSMHSTSWEPRRKGSAPGYMWVMFFYGFILFYMGLYGLMGLMGLMGYVPTGFFYGIIWFFLWF